MAEEQTDSTTLDVFSMDPNGTVDLESLTTQGQQEDTQSATAPDEQGTGEDALELAKPEGLSPELDERWEQERRKMQRGYSKAMNRVKDREKSVDTYRQKAEMVDKFYSDRAYAAQTIQQMAQQLGYTLTPASGQPQPGQPAQPQGQQQRGGEQMPEFVSRAAQEAVQDNPDLAFLAPIIAKAAWNISQAATAPLQQEAADRRKADEDRRLEDRRTEYERLRMELEEDGIDLDEHDEQLAEFVNFVRGALTNTGPWSHPRYGNLLRFFHGAVVGPQAAQAEARTRLQKAVVNRTSTGAPTRSAGVNTEQLIRDAKTQDERFGIAFRAALAEAGSQLRR
jgi:hypothetical protein